MSVERGRKKDMRKGGLSSREARGEVDVHRQRVELISSRTETQPTKHIVKDCRPHTNSGFPMERRTDYALKFQNLGRFLFPVIVAYGRLQVY